ncbi:MAG: hypothetical protein GF365_00235, partial [Candidatus Buchananbacteria bacterium]|nr:hypothetical protein [Candidatus Buchananbacteria bacterium]
LDNDWIARSQEINQDFSLDNYHLVKINRFELGPEKDDQQTLTDLEKNFYAFAPDQERFLDVYGLIDIFEFDGEIRYEASTVEMGPNIPPDFPDPNYKEPAIVNLATHKAQAIPDVSYSSVRDSFWLSDQEFVLTGYKITDNGLIPYIKYFNLSQKVTGYYEGKLNRFCENTGNCPEDMMTLKVYITGCPSRNTNVYERQVKKTNEVAKAALNQLFMGPFGSEMEPEQDHLFHNSYNAKIKEIKIIDNIAYVNLNDIRPLFSYEGPYNNMEIATKRNCEEYSFFEQATKTLNQFSTINDAIYFIEGETHLLYDFMDIACPNDLCQNNPFKPSMKKTYIYMNECNDYTRSFMRLIPQDDDIIKATLNELFKGPYNHERQPTNRYYMFNEWTSNILKDIIIKDQIAYVNLQDFRYKVTYPDYECNSPQFFASVGDTLTQFPEINDAIYFMNGDQDKFYDYMGVDCPYEKECQYNPF